MYETPPILTGNSYARLEQIRDYLVRLSASLSALEEQGSQSTAPNTAESSESSAAKSDNSAQLRALILKTAHSVQQETERLENSIKEGYMAISDFGTYAEELESSVHTTARETVESYRLDARIESAETMLSTLRGQIRRGIITDPETGESVTGIAIAERLSFSGESQQIGGETYYVLSPGQTLGLYTASGWQFWINGSLCGWFDSRDGMLHSRHMVIEQSQQLGADWQISSTDGFGIRCLTLS